MNQGKDSIRVAVRSSPGFPNLTSLATVARISARGDEMKMLPPDIAEQAETLGKAKDLKAARKAFRPLI